MRSRAIRQNVHGLMRLLVRPTAHAIFVNRRQGHERVILMRLADRLWCCQYRAGCPDTSTIGRAHACLCVRVCVCW